MMSGIEIVRYALLPQPIIKRQFYPIFTMLNSIFTDRMDKV